MQDIILIQLGFCTHRTIAYIALQKITQIVTDGIYCRTARKIWAALPLDK
jgi:hypothetical protein